MDLLSHLALARIVDSLPQEVLISVATLHKVTPHSTHRANDGFLVSEEGFKA